LSEQEKVERLRSADVFCAPSLGGESFGVVLLEAMAAGTAVVASDLPGYAKVARSDRDALLVPPGDPSALAAQLQRVLGDSTLRESLTASGSTRATEFSMDRLAALYVGLYEQVLERR
jgi:phosphatidylinositol alpha-mannosyltransferase